MTTVLRYVEIPDHVSDDTAVKMLLRIILARFSTFATMFHGDELVYMATETVDTDTVADTRNKRKPR